MAETAPPPPADDPTAAAATAAGPGPAVRLAVSAVRRRGPGALLYAGLMSAGLALASVQNLVLPRFLTPAAYGYYAIALAASAYAMPLQLGMLSGLNRELPVRLGRGQDAATAHLVGSATSVMLAIAVIAGSALCAAVFSLASVGEPATRLALMLGIGLAMSGNFAHLVILRLRAAQRIWAFPTVLLLQRGVTLGLGVVGAMLGGFVGLLVAVIAVQGLVFVAGSRWYLPAGRYWPIRWPAIGRLARVGIPVMSATALDGIVVTLDRVFLANVVSVDQLGLYQFATLPLIAGVALSSVISQYLNPKLLYGFGQDRSIRRVFRVSLLTSLGVIAAFVLTWPIAMPVLGMIVRVWVPRYAASLDIMGIFYVAGTFAAAASVSVTITAANRQGLYPVISAATGLFCLVGYTLATRRGAPMEEYALVAAGRCALQFGLLAWGGWFCARARERQDNAAVSVA